MPTRLPRLAAALVLGLASLACSLGAPPLPTTSVATPTPASATTTQPARATPTPATDSLPGATPTAAPSETIDLDALYPFDDRSPFAANLVASELPVLDTLPGASIYHIALTIDPSLARVTGRQSVRYTNQEDVLLEAIAFRLYPNLLGGRLDVTNLTADGVALPVRYDHLDTVLWADLPAPLAPGDSVVLAMDFAVDVPTDLERNYGVLAAADGVLALAHFFPFVAVYDDEGWNIEIPSEQGDVTYGDASFFIAQVRAPNSLVLAGTGTVIADDTTDAQQSLTFALGPARDFYLAGSETYQTSTLEAGETVIRVYAPPAYAAAAEPTLAAASAALGIYAARYGPYPYRDLDLVTTPTYARGIEYPGLIALTNGLLDPATTDAILLESVTAHEVGHQWFYNLVGSDQLDDPWLDESLTQYITWQYFGATGGSEAAAGYEDNLRGRWSRVGFEEIPIGLPVSDYHDAEYSAIVYGRGALFFDALAQALGQPAFDTFLSAYARDHRWGLATPASLQALAETTCACDLDDLFAEWGAD